MSQISNQLTSGTKFFNKLKSKISNITYQSLAASVLKNVKYNKKFLKKGHSIKKLLNYNNKKKNAIIIGAGPSLRRHDQIKILKKYHKKFIVIACDGSLFYLLSNKIIPDLVVTFDPHPSRVIRWFGDLSLNKKKIKKDDYFSRQDLEIMFNDEIKMNKKIINLFNKNSKKINIALGTSSSKSVVQRLIKSKSKLYWWNPFLDDPDKKNSTTKKIYNINKLPIINTGGNVGSTAWMLAESLFGCKKIGMLGMDFAYYLDTPVESTQYYDRLIKFVDKKNLKKFYSKVYNPKIKKYFYTDYVYSWYLKCFLEMVKYTKSITYNCTCGGIIFGKSIKWTTLKKFCTNRYG